MKSKSSQKMTRLNKNEIVLLCILMLILGFAGGYFLFAKTTRKLPSDTEVVYIYGFPQGSKGKYKISETVPISWRTTVLPFNNESDQFDYGNDNLGRFEYVDPKNNAFALHGEFEPVNQLEFWDITSWLDTDWLTDGQPGDIPVKSADKLQYIDFLAHLRDTKKVNMANCKYYYYGEGSRGRCDGNIAPVYVESSDKILSGYAGIDQSNDPLSYDPTIYVFMTGVLDGKIMYAEGRFVLNDKLSQKLAQSHDDHAVKSARKQLTQKLPSDMQALYDQVLASLRSIKVEYIP